MMTLRGTTAFTVLTAFAAHLVRAETAGEPKINLSSPVEFQVFQRQTKTAGKVVIEGMIEISDKSDSVRPDRLEARLIGKPVFEELTGSWQPLPLDLRVRHFRGQLSTPAGGWYRLEVRLAGKQGTSAQQNVEQVGVGEIFIVAGQSNSANHGQRRQHPKGPLVVAFSNGRWQPADDPQPGASGSGGSFLPAFGDKMAERFKVPIGLVSVGVGATSVREWLPKGDPIAAPPTTGANAVAVAEHTILLMLALLKRFVAAESAARQGGWPTMELFQAGLGDLANATVGLVGFGNIGRVVAQRLAPFGSRLLYIARHAVDAATEQQFGVHYASLDELLASSTIVSLHLPLNEATEGLIGEAELAKMTVGAFLVNTSRGELLDEATLRRALVSGKLGGAALDVLRNERPGGNPVTDGLAPGDCHSAPGRWQSCWR